MWKKGRSLSTGMRLLLTLVLSSIITLCTAQQEGDVRLTGSTDFDFQGTVGVYHKGQWGTICDDSWNRRDADVICRQLGFVRSFRIYYRAYYGQGPGPIWIDQINCPNNAQSVLDCSPKSSNWGVHDCSKREDAGVDCLRKFPRKPEKMPIRLSCPDCVQWGSCTTCSKKQHPSPTDCSPQAVVEGIVFANYNNKWLPITGEDWGKEEAKVVCGELGYPIALPGNPVPTLAQLWTNWDGSFLDDCGNGPLLLGGPSYPRCSLVEGGSGDLGLCTSDEISGNNLFRDTLKSTLLKKVQCVGNEKRLLDCYFPEFGPHANPSLKVATVRCGFKPHRSCPNQGSTEVSGH